MGGSLTKDITDGYGPEMFLLPRAESGEYLFRAHYYRGDRNRTNTATRVYVTIIRNWGTRRETVTHSTVVLAKKGQMQEIARIVIGGPGEG